MKITQITTTSRYAKLTDDVSFFVQYEANLTDIEKNTKWEVSYCPDIIFSEELVKCNVSVVYEESKVILNVSNFKDTLSKYSTIELRNVGCFILHSENMEGQHDIKLVVQTYCEKEDDETLERAIEQVI